MQMLLECYREKGVVVFEHRIFMFIRTPAVDLLCLEMLPNGEHRREVWDSNKRTNISQVKVVDHGMQMLLEYREKQNKVFECRIFRFSTNSCYAWRCPLLSFECWS
ncbi:hypothetical protein E2320_014500, partial [Naja naja]